MLSRRRLLALTGGLLAAGGGGRGVEAALSAPAVSPPSAVALPMARWATANRRLAPLAVAASGAVIAAGEAAAEAFAPDGRRLWRLDLDVPAAFAPRLNDDLALIGGRDGFKAVDIASGRLQWRYRAEAQTGAPVVGEGMAVFGDGHQVVALSLADGRVRWRFAAVADTQVAYAPVIAGGRVFVGPGDGRLYALDAAAGTLVWQRDGRKPWQYLRQIRVHGDLLVAGTYQEELLGLSMADGATRWSFYAGNFINSHAVDAGQAFLWSPTGWIYAIDAAGGAVQWRHRTTDYAPGSGGNWASVLAELVPAGRWLLCLDMAGVVHVLDRRDGTEAARWTLPADGRPFLATGPDGRLYAASGTGEVLALDPPWPAG